MKLHKVLLSEQNIRELIQMYVSSIKKNNMQRRERYKSMLWVRLADLGFDRPHIKNMVNDLTDVDTEKDVDVFMSRYKLWGDDYADSFRATESKFKLALQIPFSTEKNKDQKLKKLEFDLAIVDIKINSKKDLDVDTINPEASQNPSLQYVVMLEIETEMTRSELENTLEPDYKILKLKEV